MIYLYVESNDKLKELKDINLSNEERILKQEREKKQRLANEKRAQQNELRKSKLINHYGQTNELKIYQKKIWIGITKDMAIISWGEPDDINRTVGRGCK